MTPSQARRLRRLISLQEGWSREYVFIGSSDPEEQKKIHLAYKNAKRRLDLFIRSLTNERP